MAVGYEARCTTCGETFNPHDESDLEHVVRDDGTDCGGDGVLVGSWGSAHEGGPTGALIEALVDALLGVDDELELPGLEIAECATFADRGLMTSNRGLVLTLADGSEFQLTVVQSRGAKGGGWSVGADGERFAS